MVPLRLALVCALGVLLFLPHAATAGGWWSYVDVNRSHVAPGQRVEIDETVAFGSVAAAEEAEEAGRFYVYLLRGFDYSVVERAMRQTSPRNWWSLGDAEAIQVGQVTITVSDANLGRATAAFTMPELPPATYHLMLCDTACTEPLADVIPATDFTVVADPNEISPLDDEREASVGARSAPRRSRSRRRAATRSPQCAGSTSARGPTGRPMSYAQRESLRSSYWRRAKAPRPECLSLALSAIRPRIRRRWCRRPGCGLAPWAPPSGRPRPRPRHRHRRQSRAPRARMCSRGC
jgi:hypothetical protein